jgi:hydroxyethylthiazole kinase-like sugar kinase family protein
MGLDQYILQQFLVLDTTTLTEQQKNKLVQVFNKNAKTKLPSILEQLKTKNTVRKAIDLALLQTLGIKGNLEEMLNSAYESVAESITTLATIMKEGKIED